MTHRIALHAAVLAIIGAAALLASPARAQGACGQLRVTGYASEQFPGRTADGTPTRGSEWTLLAAHPRFPFGLQVSLDGLGSFRVADRGYLGEDHVDLLVYTAAEAFALTGRYFGCW